MLLTKQEAVRSLMQLQKSPKLLAYLGMLAATDALGEHDAQDFGEELGNSFLKCVTHLPNNPKLADTIRQEMDKHGITFDEHEAYRKARLTDFCVAALTRFKEALTLCPPNAVSSAIETFSNGTLTEENQEIAKEFRLIDARNVFVSALLYRAPGDDTPYSRIEHKIASAMSVILPVRTTFRSSEIDLAMVKDLNISETAQSYTMDGVVNCCFKFKITADVEKYLHKLNAIEALNGTYLPDLFGADFYAQCAPDVDLPTEFAQRIAQYVIDDIVAINSQSAGHRYFGKREVESLLVQNLVPYRAVLLMLSAENMVRSVKYFTEQLQAASVRQCFAFKKLAQLSPGTPFANDDVLGYVEKQFVQLDIQAQHNGSYNTLGEKLRKSLALKNTIEHLVVANELLSTMLSLAISRHQAHNIVVEQVENVYG